MTKIIIEELYDETDCETCGSSYATGFRVYIGDELKYNYEPRAHCYDSVSYEIEDVYKQILADLGYEVETVEGMP
jgi:hypothetical protein